MPTGVPIQAIPNQEFTITLDGNTFDVTIKETNGCMSVSLVINGVDTIDGIRVVAGAPVIPAKYEEAGNFMFMTANNELPYYTQFNLTQSLLYFTAAELAAYRVPPLAASNRVPTVTAAFFNPIADLPLRFSPQGYTLFS